MNYNAKLGRFLAETGRLKELYVIDVGCSQGLDPALRQLEPALAGVGIDPLIPEVERLNSVETNPKLSYIAAYAISDREYPHLPRHSVNWYGRSQSNAALNPDADVVGDLL